MKQTVYLALCVLVLALCNNVVANRGGEHREAAFLRRRLSPHRHGFVTIDHKYTIESDAALTVSPSTLCARNGSFTVQWTGIPNPGPKDWIAIYSPANSTANDYLDYVWVQDMQGNNKTDAGSMTVVLLNMRTDYQLRYFSGGNQLLATSNTISVCSIPMHAHIALTGDPSEMRVGFVSSAPYTPIVLYGTDPNNLNMKATGKTDTYTADDMCNAPANVVGARLFRDPGYMQDVLLTNLPPSTRIYYTYGAADGSEMSTDVLDFMTAPPQGSTGPINIMVYGDMGDGVLTPDAAGTAQRMVDHMSTTNFYLHIGDISYARSIGWVWDEFFNLIYNFASRVPYMVGIGNHEYDHTGGVNKDPSGAPGAGFHPDWGNYGDDSAGECAVPPFHRFHMPDNGNSLFWYSFNYGNVHVLHMSTEHDFTPGSPQYQWMQQDLAAVDRSVTPWVILGGHRPMYTSEDYPSDFRVSQNMQLAFEDLLYQNGVDIAVWGHYHAYERTCAVYKQNCMTDGTGTTHIVVGTAGASLDNVDWYPETWSLNHCNEFGYGKISVTTDQAQQSTSLKWDFFFNANDTRFDTVTLTKSLSPLSPV